MHKVYRDLNTGLLYRYLHFAITVPGGKRVVVYEDDYQVLVKNADEFYREFEIAYDPSRPLG